MTTQDVGPWPTIPIVAPRDDGRAALTGALLEPPTEEQAADLAVFYATTLVPQLACSTDGKFPALPTLEMIRENAAVVVHRDGTLVGSWILRESEILYPCAVVDDIAGIFRALWAASTEARTHIWGSTGNETIMRFAQATGVDREAWRGGVPSITLERIEWKVPPGGQP